MIERLKYPAVLLRNGEVEAVSVPIFGGVLYDCRNRVILHV
jgi:hypothetical protein